MKVRFSVGSLSFSFFILAGAYAPLTHAATFTVIGTPGSNGGPSGDAMAVAGPNTDPSNTANATGGAGGTSTSTAEGGRKASATAITNTADVTGNGAATATSVGGAGGTNMNACCSQGIGGAGGNAASDAIVTGVPNATVSSTAAGGNGGATVGIGGDANVQATGIAYDATLRFVSAVVAMNEDHWQEIFAQSKQPYQPPTLVLFRGRTQSACGLAQSAMGPFYCPGDRKIYLDTSFLGELERRFHGCEGSACQFSQAYVIAHEYGHHVQNLLGILPAVQQKQHAMGKTEAKRMQVRVELQADCLAGVWASRQQEKRAFLDPGDVAAARKTASAVGDDQLQRQARGVVMPDSFIHGSSEQRVRWFSTGWVNGTVESCNTFADENL